MNQSTRTPPPPFEGDFEATAIESQWERIADKPCIRVIFALTKKSRRSTAVVSSGSGG